MAKIAVPFNWGKINYKTITTENNTEAAYKGARLPPWTSPRLIIEWKRYK